MLEPADPAQPPVCFCCLAMAMGGIQTLTVVGMGAIHGTPASVATWRCRDSCVSGAAE